jgi:hypothetical protein
MNILIEININGNKQSQHLMISFDEYGNLYLNDSANQNQAYQLNISGKNIPYFDFGYYKIISEYTGKAKTFVALDKDSLKTKIKTEIEREFDNYNSDDEYDLENNIDYYPEDTDYLNNEDENENGDENENENGDENEDDYNENEDNHKFTFWTNIINNQFSIFNRENGDIMALYDVYIYKDDKLMFRSNSIDNSSIYRFKINVNGDIHFRPIGHVEKKFKLELDNCLLKFVETKEQN